MSKIKRKIYKIDLWLYSEDVVVEIHEYTIKRKGAEKIHTEEGEELYSYKLEKPCTGFLLGDDCIGASMLTEDFMAIDNAINKMVESARQTIDLQIKSLTNMHKELDSLYEKEVIFSSKSNGMYYLKKGPEEINMKPFRIDKETITVNEYVKAHVE